MPTQEAPRAQEAVGALPRITEPHGAITTAEALEIDAHLGEYAASFRETLRDEVTVVEEGLEDELPETDDGLYVLSQHDLHAVISRAVMAGASVTVHEVGSRIRTAQDLEEILALDLDPGE